MSVLIPRSYNKENDTTMSSCVPPSSGSGSGSGSEFKPWGCSQCSKRFAMKRGLTVHVDTIHENSKRFECYLCPRVFNQKGNLNNHIRVSHEGSKDYQCELCEWKFSAVALLDKHMISVHKVDPSFDCDICGQIFESRKLLRKHKVSFHKDSTGNRMHEVRKRFYCGFCSQGFSFKTFLDKHMGSVHSGKASGYVCKVCDKHFEDKAALDSHTATKHKQIHLQQQESSSSSAAKVVSPPQQILLTIPENPQQPTTQMIPTSIQQNALQIQPQQQQIFYQPYPTSTVTPSAGRYYGSNAASVSTEAPLQVAHFQYQPPLGTTAQPTLLYQPASSQQPHQIQIQLQPLSTIIPSNASSILSASGGLEATTTTPVQLMIQEPAAEVCKLCHLPCSDKAELDKHMALFHNFPCEICGEKFSSFEGLTSHKISHLTPCPICEVRFKETTSLLSHFIQSHEGKELCNVCFGEVFESKEALAVHLEGVHGPETKVVCEESLASIKNEVKEHKKFVSVVDELVVQLQKAKDKSRKRKAPKEHPGGGGSAPKASTQQHLGNGNNNTTTPSSNSLQFS
eukprot:TRINITY_DN1891_c0_g1_i1.p1 TRINITY_DN1891_c0_g1~~TRINITY_DN1891_c0_g1_i1.p1  ORF type:complete len:568 (-),score=221.62 TRINITY_DN1891_c0_g1_i1:924-2627(-)